MVCGIKEVKLEQKLNPIYKLDKSIKVEIYVKKKNHLCGKYTKTK